MLENYVTYLNFLSGKFTKFFEKQKPFIFCKKGCGKCCKNAEFPYSQIEAEYLMFGVWIQNVAISWVVYDMTKSPFIFVYSAVCISSQNDEV